MLFVFDVRRPDGDLRDMARQIILEIGLVVNIENNVTQTMLDGSRGVTGGKRAHSDTVAQEKLLVDRSKLLEL
jgi:hypothetical protein